jgi:predicted signal transduction protein with EAL and GGDEF domain
MGLKVALDDFGSGQSSLSYVHQLSLDKIKIDRGFIRNIATQENARNIVKTVIDLCRNLKFDCVVEGVETAEQGRDHRPSRLLGDAGIFFCKADAAGRGRDLHRKLPHVGSSANGRCGRVRFDQRPTSQHRC